MQLHEREARDRLCEQSGGLAAAFVVEKKPAVGQPQTVFQFLKLHAVVQGYDHPPGGEYGEIRGKPGSAARSEKGDVPICSDFIQRGGRLFAEAVELRAAYIRHLFVCAQKEFSVRKAACRVLCQAAHIGICQGDFFIHTITRLISR